MKTIRLMLIGLILFIAGVMQAQFSLSVNFGAPPPWGPVGYTSVRYYYLPDVEAYYDVRSSMFIYFNGSAWIHRTYLPARYRNYDLYRGYKVVMPDYHGNAPYVHFKDHRVKYSKGYHGKAQRTIGERPGSGHPGTYNDRGNPGGNHEKGKSGGYGNDKAGSHGKDKGNSHGNGNGNGKKK